MARNSRPSGVDSVAPPPPGTSAIATADHFLKGWEATFKDARRVAKRRASAVTVWNSVLTGVIAVLGTLGAVTASDWFGRAIAIATTAAAALSAVLIAWDTHFRHWQLWVQRSSVVSEISRIRRDFALWQSLDSSERVPEEQQVRSTMRELDDVLKRDIREWSDLHTR